VEAILGKALGQGRNIEVTVDAGRGWEEEAPRREVRVSLSEDGLSNGVFPVSYLAVSLVVMERFARPALAQKQRGRRSMGTQQAQSPLARFILNPR